MINSFIMDNDKYTIGIITINSAISDISYCSDNYNIKLLTFSSKRGIIFNNLLKFKTFLTYRDELLLCNYIVHINNKINENEFLFLSSNIDSNSIKTIGFSGDLFSCSTQIFLELSNIVNNYIQNDLNHDINVTNWNYQINKYLKSSSNVINLESVTKPNLNHVTCPTIKFVTASLSGGLGNLLFQIVATHYYGKVNNLKPIFCVNKNNSSRPSICKYRIFDNLTKYSLQDDIQFVNKYESEYHNICENQNIKLFGLFHDKKYISDAILNINNILNFDDLIHIDINKYKMSTNLSNLVSIHVRRTDYLKCNIYHILDKNYYYEAINNFDTHNTLFLIFSDDIDWCKQSDYFSNAPNKLYIEDDMFDEEELYLMSLCDHNIIANSTFSLWGYYLNKNPDKKTIIPKKWFASNMNFDPFCLVDSIDKNVIFI